MLGEPSAAWLGVTAFAKWVPLATNCALIQAALGSLNMTYLSAGLIDEAQAINSNGWIVGISYNEISEEAHAFLMHPTEPAEK